MPLARDPDGAEARLLELAERRPGVADGVVDGADEEPRFVGRLRVVRVVAAAGGERQRRKDDRTANGTLLRTTTAPGRVA